MRRLWITAGLGLLAACAAPIETMPVSAPLAPAALPQAQVGRTLTYQTAPDKEDDETVVAVDGQRVSWQSSDGGRWTALTPLSGNSATSWAVADGEGQQAFSPDPGALFPLAVGKSAKVSYQGVNNGEAYQGQQRCAVKEEARVEVPAGAFDTFVVVCERGGDLSRPYSTRTYYYAPAVGAPVFQIVDERGRRTRASKLVRYSGSPS